MRSLSFLGRISRLDVPRQLEVADVFVLPSLAEGSAEATYEALAGGVPVVTTAEAGSALRATASRALSFLQSHPRALATRVRQIVEDRKLRERMSHAARQRAREFTIAKYSDGLPSCWEPKGGQFRLKELCEGS